MTPASTSFRTAIRAIISYRVREIKRGCDSGRGPCRARDAPAIGPLLELARTGIFGRVLVIREGRLCSVGSGKKVGEGHARRGVGGGEDMRV